MSPIARAAIWVAERLESRHTTIPFTNHTASTATVIPFPGLSTPDRASASTPERSETAGTPTSQPPRLVGAGRHANGCAYLDDPGHICVDDTGQPSTRVCLATWYLNRRLHPAGKGAI